MTDTHDYPLAQVLDTGNLVHHARPAGPFGRHLETRCGLEGQRTGRDGGTARITDAHKKIHEAWVAARTQYPTQPPQPVTTLCAAALAQMEKACAAVEAGGTEGDRG